MLWLSIEVLGGFVMLGAGICTTVRAAQDLRIIAPDQVDEILLQATENAG